MIIPGPGAPRARFADFELDPVTHELWRAGRPVPLKPQPRHVLALLVENAGQAVSRDAIRRAVWDEGVHVDFDLGLNSCLAQLRRALGDVADAPRFIETVPRFGYRFIAPVFEAEAPAPLRPSPRRALWVPALLAVGAALAALAFVPREAAVSSTPVMVVLPFRAASGDALVGLATDAVTEETTTYVARLAPERLGVIAWTSAVQYSRSPLTVAQIGRALNADYAVEGSVAIEAGRAHVNARLVRTRDQVHVWAGTCEEDAGRLGALSRSVARQVARAVAQALLGGEATARARAGTEDEGAYRDYLRGRQETFLGTADSVRAAVARFQAAVAADPAFAAGHAGLAGALLLETPPSLALARRQAQRGIDLDPELPEAHAVLARALAAMGEAAGADREFQLALELDGNDSLTHDRYAEFLVEGGRLAEADAHNRQARRLNPLCVEARLTTGRILMARGRAADAQREFAAVVASDPAFPPGHERLAQALAAQGHIEEARSTLGVALSAGASPQRVAALLQRLPASAVQPSR